MNYRELQQQLNELKSKGILPKTYSLKQPKEVLQKKYNSIKNNFFKISLQRGEGKHDEIFDKNGDRIPATVVYTWKEGSKRNIKTMGYNRCRT